MAAVRLGARVTNPFTFRPDPKPEFNPDGPDGGADGGADWTDNALSNALAWTSRILLPAWCQTPEHWTSRVTDYVFSDCPCCMFFRGVTIGGALTLAWAVPLSLLAGAMLL